MARAETIEKTRSAWNYTRARGTAFVALGHLSALSVEASQKRRRHERLSTSRTARLFVGWEVYAECTADEFSGGRTREEECDLEDMLRLAGRL